MPKAKIFFSIFFVLLWGIAFPQWEKTNSSNYVSVGPILNVNDTALFVNGNSIFGASGMFISRDSAKSWKPIGNSLKFYPLAFRNNHFVGYTGDPSSPCNNGIYVSSDYGNNWIKISSGLPSGTGCHVSQMTISDSNVFVGLASGELYRSNFITANSLWTNITGTIGPNIALSLNYSNGVLCFGNSGSGFWASTDQGQSWTKYIHRFGFPYRAESIVFDHPDVYVVHRDTLFQGQIGTYSWTPANFNGHGNYLWLNSDQSYCVKGNQKMHFSVTSFPSICAYTFNGINWSYTKNLISYYHPFTPIIYDGAFFARISSMGLVKLNPVDSSWHSSSYGLSLIDIIDITKSGNKLLAIGKTGGLYSSDTGKNWIPEFKLKGIDCNAIFAADSFVFVGSKNGLYRSTNYGNSWSYVSSTSPINFKKFIKKNATFIAASSTGIFISNDNGITWSSAGTFANPFINDLFISADTVYCATNKGIYKSLNSGSNWSLINNQLKDSAVVCVTGNSLTLFASTAKVLRESSDNLNTLSTTYSSANTIKSVVYIDSALFVAGVKGCYVRKKNSTNWVFSLQYLDDPNSFYSVKSIDTMIYALSFEMGIQFFRTSNIKYVGLEKNQLKKMNFDVYPNPTIETITIELPIDDDFEITLLDINNTTLLKRSFNSTEKKNTSISVDGLPSGVYILRISDSNSNVSTKKIVKIK